MTTLAAPDTNLVSMKDLPRPPLHPMLGWAAFWVAPDYARSQFDKRGERMYVDVPLIPPMLFTSSPEDAHAVFTDRSGALLLGEALRRLAPHELVFGTEMIDWFNGENHAALRRKVSPAFHGNALRGYEQAIADAAQTRLQEWPLDRPIRLQEHMLTLGRDVIMSVVFGVTQPERRARLEEALIELDHLAVSPGLKARYVTAMAMRGHWLPYPRMDRINAKLDAVALEEIAYRRANPSDEPRTDSLEVFLQIQADDPDGMLSDDMIASFLRLLLVAGYETTGVTLSWVVERIARHPEVLTRLDEAIADGDDDYVDAVITETMRMRPALPVTLRYAVEDVEVNGMLVPAGTVVMIYINAIQNRADIYPEPDRFNPERFVGVRPDPRTWLPFGGGAHRCLGGAFSMFEARVLLKTILTHRAIEPDTSSGERIDQHRGVLLQPHNGARVTLRSRQAELSKP